MNISRAFKLPFSGEGWIKTILIGFAITAVSMLANNVEHVGWLINTLLGSVTLGYCVRVMRNETRAAEGAQPVSLPKWDTQALKDIFVDGLLLTVVNMVYGLIFGIFALVVTMLFGMTGFVTAALSGEAAVPVGGGLALVWFAAMAVMGIFFAFYSAIMMAHYSHEDRISAAFEIATILKKLFGSFGNACVAALTSLLLVALVMLSAITIVGLPLGVFVSQVIGSSIWGQVYRSSKN